MRAAVVKAHGEMAEHTPGPWWIVERVFVCPVGNESQDIADCSGNAFSWDEKEANARLISAAPTMYNYIKVKAEEGDERAKEILCSLQQFVKGEN